MFFLCYIETHGSTKVDLFFSSETNFICTCVVFSEVTTPLRRKLCAGNFD